jgi:hypothetical protein
MFISVMQQEKLAAPQFHQRFRQSQWKSAYLSPLKITPSGRSCIFIH